MAALIGLLKFVEYRYFARDLSLEIYIGAIALVFIILGAWIGRRLTRERTITVEVEVPASTDPFIPDAATIKQLGITKREYEVLELVAEGLSNQQVADRLFVSTSTVKTHTSSLFSKLDADRRTQALQKAREASILP